MSRILNKSTKVCNIDARGGSGKNTCLLKITQITFKARLNDQYSWRRYFYCNDEPRRKIQPGIFKSDTTATNNGSLPRLIHKQNKQNCLFCCSRLDWITVRLPRAFNKCLDWIKTIRDFLQTLLLPSKRYVSFTREFHSISFPCCRLNRKKEKPVRVLVTRTYLEMSISCQILRRSQKYLNGKFPGAITAVAVVFQRDKFILIPRFT